jgi:Rha family phage regulatory protein
MNELTKTNQENGMTIDSREVAEMVDKEHGKLLRDIRTYCDYLAEANLGLGKYFIESTYLDGNNQERPCYLVTKMGCELCASKMIGKKGIIFSAKYVEKFNEMEQYINQETQFKLPQNFKEALQYLIIAEEEKERLNEVIQIQTPKVNYYEEVLNPTDTSIKLLTSTEIAKDLGFKSAQKLHEILHELGVIYKKINKTWCVYADYDFLMREYFADYRISQHGQSLVWSEKGRKWIIELLKDNEII